MNDGPQSSQDVGASSRPCRLGSIVVQVLRKDEQDLSEPADVELTGPVNETKPTDPETDRADFTKLPKGDYTIKVIPKGEENGLEFEQPHPYPTFIGYNEEDCVWITLVVAHIDFTITDQFGEPVSGIDYVLTYLGETEETVEEQKLTDGNLYKEKVDEGEYKLALKTFSEARWGAEELDIDQAVTLTTKVFGYQDGEAVTFNIYDSLGLNADALDSLQGTVAGTDLEVEWTPTLAKLENSKSGHLVFTAGSGEQFALSDPVPIFVTSEYSLDEEGLQDDTRIIVHFYGGASEELTTADAKAGCRAPLNARVAWVELPDLNDAAITITEDGLEANFLLL